ncbi:hypothetical protein LTR62_005215 [Meristemomyces frigidus]|uniref:Uncharacterized protein n=1 Tax=Meristemomyces frigidus TaxID=1508187 RepID=A0AAN7TEL8_9PEZI|nr:hypothetical protein LTR62_005215 [Meristemomyces frigidus]
MYLTPRENNLHRPAQSATAPKASSRTARNASRCTTVTNPEKETYRLLVDVLRLRREDKSTFEVDTMPGTIYNGEASSRPAFRKTLQRAKQLPGLLPLWWTDVKEAECLWENRKELQRAQEKADIQEY